MHQLRQLNLYLAVFDKLQGIDGNSSGCSDDLQQLQRCFAIGVGGFHRVCFVVITFGFDIVRTHFFLSCTGVPSQYL